jgi:hypothetical protein
MKVIAVQEEIGNQCKIRKLGENKRFELTLVCSKLWLRHWNWNENSDGKYTIYSIKFTTKGSIIQNVDLFHENLQLLLKNLCLMKLKVVICSVISLLFFSSLSEKNKKDSIKANYDFSKRDDQLLVASKWFNQNAKGTFNVWTKPGNNPKIKVLLLRWTGLTHELYESRRLFS